jgi:hypothetical protein
MSDKPDALVGECLVAGEEAPNWVCAGYDQADAFTASGSAKFSALGFDFTRKEALANARADLANQVELAVKAKVESYMRSTGAKTETAERVVTQVSRQVSNVGLKQSKQISFWQHPKNQSIFVLVSVPKAMTQKMIDEQVPKAFDADQNSQINNAGKALNSI